MSRGLLVLLYALAFGAVIDSSRAAYLGDAEVIGGVIRTGVVACAFSGMLLFTVWWSTGVQCRKAANVFFTWVTLSASLIFLLELDCSVP
jgi:hypothetical protein